MELLDDFQPYAGLAVAGIGAALVFVGMARGSRVPERDARSDDANRT
jgi:hypothetical protein